jgi:hypothetical protein
MAVSPIIAGVTFILSHYTIQTDSLHMYSFGAFFPLHLIDSGSATVFYLYSRYTDSLYCVILGCTVHVTEYSILCRNKTGGGSLTCHDEELLLLKATSQATVLCMESALAMLQVSKVMVCIVFSLSCTGYRVGL